MKKHEEPSPDPDGVEDGLLLAYVDGMLSPQEQAKVQALLRESPEAARRLALLEASQLPYQEAFARQAIPPVPASLTEKVEALLKQHRAAGETTDAGRQNTAVPGYVHPPYHDDAPRQAPVGAMGAPVRRASSLRMLVAFAAGALCCALVLELPYGPLASRPALSPWVQAVVTYQALYTRDTVARDGGDPAGAMETLRQIRQDDGIALPGIPDLSAAGLAFKRVQRLNFNGKPLIQLVYQPAQGEPVALCVIADPKPDELVAMQKAKGMTVATWRRDRLGYALVGHADGVDLQALGRRIADNQVGSLTAGARNG